MQIFVINLDRKPMRWQRMAGLLQGLPFRRLAAVDGNTIHGPEYNIPSRPGSPAVLSRYNRACTLSHRAAMQDFLAGTDRYCCVLEDDVFISPDFPRFINDESWIPSKCDLVKIETTRQEVRLASKGVACLDREAVLLDSVHFGTAGYIVSRRGAQMLLGMTAEPERSIDRILFEPAGLRKLRPVQLIPALCIQAGHLEGGMIFPEMESSIQPRVPVQKIIPERTERKTLPVKIKREAIRPFRQLNGAVQRTGLRLRGLRWTRVPFA
ncbi:MAG: glycosyltransferase family 25 protein [Verrucomicrobia bacterium]|nr:glycosyltransferase family 25 protein [Verrucomicrobiota bacterium]